MKNNLNSVTFFVFIIFCLQACKNNDIGKIQRPRDPWAFRSVLDKQPRILTLALDTECYVAYDLAHCKLYKVWKGGVSLEGAAYTNKKDVQPATWGASYSNNLQNTWSAEIDGKKDTFQILNKGYRFKNNQIYLKFLMILSNQDTIQIEERPEFIRSEEGKPGLERAFMLSGVPSGVTVSLKSGNTVFPLKANATSRLVAWFNPLPPQYRPSPETAVDNTGKYWMEKSDCFTCHELDKKTVGPSFNQVAQRYQQEKNPASHLIRKVKEGGSGTWGSSVMTAHPDLTENEIKVMLDYILSLKPAEKKISASIPDKQPDENKKVKPGFGAPLEGVHPSFNVQTIHKSNFKPRVGGLAFLPDGRLLVTTWDSIGAVYMLSGIETGDTNKINVKRIASGLAEPLGIEVVNDEIYVLQKQELTKLIDVDGDEIIDEYQAVCNSWGVTADFHEFAFGLVYKDGYFYVSLSMAMRLMSHEKQLPDRGRTLKISRDGSYEWVNYGLRTPNGIGLGIDNEIFECDNQGQWVPANKLIHVKKGEYHGMRWGILDSLSKPPPVAMPAIYLPEDEIGNSPSEPVLIKDGPYKGQMLHGDVTYGGIQRDFLEKVNGEYQGAVFRFTQGLEAGINRMRFGPDGALYVGGIGMVGGWSWKEKQYGLQRLHYNGKSVFEMLSVHAQPKGFDIELTEPISDSIRVLSDDILVQQWWYLPTSDYGGPKKDLEKLKISSLKISHDRKHIEVQLPGLKERRVVYFRLPEYLKSNRGQSLWSGETWYTLNNIPEK
ncbi:MAG: cytochrome C [Bacteroidetes bacterium]|nr:cytochrome C [Bacteroidota bacterium]